MKPIVFFTERTSFKKGPAFAVITNINCISCDIYYFIFLKAAITDAAGEPVISADELLVAEAEGAQLLGFGSGDPKSLLNYNEGRCKTWKGRAQLILRKNGTGPIRVCLSSDSGLRAVWEQA